MSSATRSRRKRSRLRSRFGFGRTRKPNRSRLTRRKKSASAARIDLVIVDSGASFVRELSGGARVRKGPRCTYTQRKVDLYDRKIVFRIIGYAGERRHFSAFDVSKLGGTPGHKICLISHSATLDLSSPVDLSLLRSWLSAIQAFSGPGRVPVLVTCNGRPSDSDTSETLTSHLSTILDVYRLGEPATQFIPYFRFLAEVTYAVFYSSTILENPESLFVNDCLFSRYREKILLYRVLERLRLEEYWPSFSSPSRDVLHSSLLFTDSDGAKGLDPTTLSSIIPLRVPRRRLERYISSLSISPSTLLSSISPSSSSSSTTIPTSLSEVSTLENNGIPSSSISSSVSSISSKLMEEEEMVVNDDDIDNIEEIVALSRCGSQSVQLDHDAYGQQRELVLSVENDDQQQHATHPTPSRSLPVLPMYREDIGIDPSPSALLPTTTTLTTTTTTTTTTTIPSSFQSSNDFEGCHLVLGECIQAGGFSRVRRGKLRSSDGSDSMNVAIKELPFCGQEEEREAVLREIGIMKAVSSMPHIVQLYGCWYSTRKQCFHVVMELCAQGSLGMNYHRFDTLPLRVGILLQIAVGMREVHKLGFVHSDLKPANILLTDSNQIKIADFGVASRAKTLDVKSISGTPQYMAMELSFGTVIQEHSAMVDVYAFGIIAWEVLTGGEYGEPFRALAGLNPFAKVQRIHQEHLRPDKNLVEDRELRELMCECWSDEIRQRPSFAEVVGRLRLLRVFWLMINSEKARL